MIPHRDPNTPHEHFDLSRNIFAVSAQMLGICITVIGLLHAAVLVSQIQIINDDMIAANSLLFLASCIASYVALRIGAASAIAIKIERVADYIFLTGLCLMVVNCFMLVYAVV